MSKDVESSPILSNLNRSGADLEMFYNTLGFVCLNISSGFVFVFEFLKRFIGVTFCTALCIGKSCFFCFVF